jgi:hypothetical protein
MYYHRWKQDVSIKLNVINPTERKANASDIPIQYNYESVLDGSIGVGQVYANNAGAFIKMSPDRYVITSFKHEGLNPFLNSFSSYYSKDALVRYLLWK